MGVILWWVMGLGLTRFKLTTWLRALGHLAVKEMNLRHAERLTRVGANTYGSNTRLLGSYQTITFGEYFLPKLGLCYLVDRGGCEHLLILAIFISWFHWRSISRAEQICRSVWRMVWECTNFHCPKTAFL